MAAKDFIVAIELGSTKITGIAGKKSMDGSIQILAVVREDATSCIRKGVVYNIDKTSVCLNNVIKKLRTLLKSDISQVYVGVGGQSIHSVKNVIVKNIPDDCVITQDMINELMDNNRSMSYPDQEILDAATQEYKVGTQYQIDPVGIQCNKLEGNFLNILCRKSFYRNLNKCFESAGIAIAEMYLAPIALAHSVLTDTEKRSGCMLVDLGADTTTVSVYYKNILRHLAVIPLGGNNITKDITSLQIEEKDAEELKLKYASAYTEPAEIEKGKSIPLDNERSIDCQTFVDLVEARMNEIIENAWYQVPKEYTTRLLQGIILTGGGSNMKNIKRAFTEKTRITKVRIAGTVTQNVTSTDKDVNAQNGTMCTAIGLLAKGDMNCAGQPINQKTDLFGSNNTTGATTPTDTTRPPRKIGELEPGTVMTDRERQLIEDEKKRRLEAEAAKEKAIREYEEMKKKKEEEANKKKNNRMGKMFRSIQEFGKKLISDEDEGDQK